MKKLFFLPVFVLAVLATVGCKGFKTADAPEGPDTTITDSVWGAQMYGFIGSANDCNLYFFNGEGDFEYTYAGKTKMKRVVKLETYDPGSGRLILSCNDVNGGSYTGSYNGILQKSDSTLTYKGIYTNCKGVEIKFDLSGQYLTEATRKPMEIICWDKVTCEVKGPVKKIQQNGITINFTKDGKIISWDWDGEEVSFDRSHGRISHCGGIDWFEEYTYDVANGRISKTEFGGEGGYFTTETYNYDTEGNVVSIRVKEENCDNDYNENVTTSNATHKVKQVYDSHGNWISRTFNGYTTNRTITYFE